jgi:hypothetical protein
MSAEIVKRKILRGIMRTLYEIHRAKMCPPTSLHPKDQQGLPCCHNFNQATTHSVPLRRPSVTKAVLQALIQLTE